MPDLAPTTMPLPGGMVMTGATVERIEPLAGRFRRVRLRIDGPHRLRVPGLAPAFKLFLPQPGSGQVDFPAFDEQRLPYWRADQEVPLVRSYTVRRIDAADGIVEFDLLDLGQPDWWPARVRPGTVIGFVGLKHALVPAASEILARGDASALPAIGALIESAPRGVQVRAELSGVAAAEQALLAPGGTHPVRYLEDEPDGVGETGADTQLWLAGEVRSVGRWRRQALTAGVPAARIHALAYYCRGQRRDEFDRVLMRKYREAAGSGRDIADPVTAADIEFS